MILDNTTALYQEQLEEAASDAASILMEGSFEELPHEEQVMVQHYFQAKIFLEYAIWQRILMPIPTKLAQLL